MTARVAFFCARQNACIIISSATHNKRIVTHWNILYNGKRPNQHIGDATMSHYHHISTEERKSISELFYAGHAIRQIAARLGRSPSSTSRELRRNRSDVASAVLYHPEAATLA